MSAESTPARARFRVQVVDAAGRPVPARGLAPWLERLAPRQAAGTLTIAIVSDRASRTLNRSYRGLDRATDVLSFPAAPMTRAGHPAPRTAHPAPRTAHPAPRTVHPAPLPVHLGDIVIARGVARRQARDAGHAETTEWRVLALHGLLHLLGYDHETDAGRMGRAERRLRRAGGLEDGLIERGSRR